MKAILAILVALALGGAAYWYYHEQGTPAVSTTATTTSQMTYSRSDFGITFSYPDRYTLQERQVTDEYYSIVLIEKMALENIPEGGEGPPTISIDVYNDSQSAEDWVRNAPQSNFTLSTGALRPTKVGGADAVTYTWDGLYRGESYVFSHKNRIIMMSVTSLTQEDQILKDFDAVRASVTLQD